MLSVTAKAKARKTAPGAESMDVVIKQTRNFNIFYIILPPHMAPICHVDICDM